MLLLLPSKSCSKTFLKFLFGRLFTPTNKIKETFHNMITHKFDIFLQYAMFNMPNSSTQCIVLSIFSQWANDKKHAVIRKIYN